MNLKFVTWQKALTMYGKDVIVLKQSKYKKYQIWITMALFLFLQIVIGIMSYVMGLYYLIILTPILVGGLIYGGFLRDILDYFFYFIVVTPSQIIQYNQSIFQENTIIFSISSLKNIFIVKNGLFSRIYDYGYVEFAFEGGANIGIHFIENVRFIKDDIGKIVQRNIIYQSSKK